MVKKPSPPSKFASDSVKTAYQAKLQDWEANKDARAMQSSDQSVDDLLAAGDDTGSLETTTGPGEVGAGTSEAADSAGLGAAAAGVGEPEEAVRHDDGDPVKLDVSEIVDPTEATREQYDAQYLKLQSLIVDGVAADPSRHDEVQQLTDWIAAYEQHAGATTAQLLDDVLGTPPLQLMALDLAAGPDWSAVTDVVDGEVVALRELPNPVSEPLDHALLNPAVKITTDDAALGAALVEAGATSVHIIKPSVDTFGWLGDPIAGPAEPVVNPALLETEPLANAKRRRYTTKTGQHQNIGGVAIPGGEHGLVLGPDDHRLSGFVGYHLNVVDVEDDPTEE